LYPADVHTVVHADSSGELRASGQHVSSLQPMEIRVTEKDQFHYYIEITPDLPGEYVINMMWSDCPLTRSPLR